MRKFLSIILSFIVCVTASYAWDVVKIGGIYYRIITGSHTAEVLGRDYNYYKITNEDSTRVVIPAYVTYNDISYRVTVVNAHAFEKDKNLSYISLPNTITLIGTRAFSGCKNLESIDLPNSVKKRRIGHLLG